MKGRGRWADLLRVGQFWLLGLAVTVGSLYPLPTGVFRGGGDKLLHLSGYLILFLSLDSAFARGRHWVGKFISLLLYSWVVEILQHFLPPRQYSLGDLAANLAGLAMGLVAAMILRRIYPA